jgi:hypothetical protein
MCWQWDLRFSQWWRCQCFLLGCDTMWTRLHLQWRQGKYVSPKHWYLPISLHSITTQKNNIDDVLTAGYIDGTHSSNYCVSDKIFEYKWNSLWGRTCLIGRIFLHITWNFVNELYFVVIAHSIIFVIHIVCIQYTSSNSIFFQEATYNK